MAQTAAFGADFDLVRATIGAGAKQINARLIVGVRRASPVVKAILSTVQRPSCRPV